ncbi:Z1 domain-containing protein [Chryseobacterium gleum]|uniref:Z1 domain-containing protein n=1 Tax=Chryseobacterium gleum TaxID=250 RepID=UPI001E593864|nr:Z1 domain-containing protein [Chryseobacterium gleum]MCE4064735.1 Z1 domain-containing protein [Chryseobacterium gleum]
MAEIIEITGSTNPNNSKWQPYQGEEIEALLKYKGFTDNVGNINTTGERVIDETFKILEMCGNPNEQENVETGLVIGYVQSGKTLSFTSVAALANDNQYQIVIIIAGTSVPLSEQSFERMKKDLQIETRFDRRWTIIKNAGTLVDRDTIEMKLEQWADPTFPKENCSTLLITVMKNGNRLRNLTSLLTSLNLNGVPTLIIDDESDQASLNTRARANAKAGEDVNEGDASTIYRRITELRAVFPHHTFLQYTATPQANLFINIMDRLSPNFIKLLTPGNGYTGGDAFFIQNPHLVKRIPTNEIPSNNNPVHEPPESLLFALKIFFLGVVAGEIKKDQRNRSMMVHPSRLTDSQNTFFNWIRNACESWKTLLQSNSPSDEDEKNELLKEFRDAYNDLRLTVNDLPSFEELTNTRLLHSIKNTRIMEVNASKGKTPEVRWSDFYSHILVGGQAMDRGFTVEGLTVSYMPRPLATGQVDTTLQRARFFGYKGSYLGFCRVWLDNANIEAFRAIIEHEEDVRKRLEDFDVNNKHLNDWDREAVLDQMLRLTRPNVLYNDIDRDYFGQEWFTIGAPHDTESLIDYNKSVVADFSKNHIDSFTTNQGHTQRTDLQKHLEAELPLEVTLKHLLNRLKFTRETDSQTYSSLRGLLSSYLQDNPNETCLVYLMSAKKVNNSVDQNIRQRRLNRNDNIKQLFQGEQPTKNGKFKIGEVYVGDRNTKDQDKVTIQIHRLKLTDGKGNEIINEDGNIAYSNLISIAVWLPKTVGKDIIRQPDNV